MEIIFYTARIFKDAKREFILITLPIIIEPISGIPLFGVILVMLIVGFFKKLN